MNTKLLGWLQGLAAVFIIGGADGLLNMGIAPEVFNLNGGLKALLTCIFLKGLLGAAAYLKQSPLPGVESDNRSLTIKPSNK